MRVLRLLQNQGMSVFVSWGTVVWSSLLPEVMRYDSTIGVTTTVSITPVQISRIPLDLMCPNTFSDKVSSVWVLLSTFSMQHLWKAQCSRVVGGEFFAVQQVVQAIWGEMVLTLKAQFDNIKGISETAVLKRIRFLQQWRGMGFFTDTNHKLQWEFAPPKWLFPPPIT